MFKNLEKKVDDLLKQGIEKTAASISGKNEGNVELPPGGKNVDIGNINNKDANPNTKSLIDANEKTKTTGGATPGNGPAIQAALDDRQYVGDKTVGDANSTIGKEVKDSAKSATSGKTAAFTVEMLNGMFKPEDASKEKIAELISTAMIIAAKQANAELEKSASFKPEEAFKDSVLLKMAYALNFQSEKANGIHLEREMDKLAEKLVTEGAFVDKESAAEYVKEAGTKLNNDIELMAVATNERIRAYKLAHLKENEGSDESGEKYESELHKLLGKKDK